MHSLILLEPRIWNAMSYNYKVIVVQNDCISILFRFTFSTNESEKETNSLLAEHPGDINNLGDQDSGDTNVPKSILKVNINANCT